MAWPPPSAHDIRHTWPKLKSISSKKPSSICRRLGAARAICSRPRDLRRQDRLGRRGAHLRSDRASYRNPRLCSRPRQSRGARSDGSPRCCISRQWIARKLRCGRRSSLNVRQEDELGQRLISVVDGWFCGVGCLCPHVQNRSLIFGGKRGRHVRRLVASLVGFFDLLCAALCRSHIRPASEFPPGTALRPSTALTLARIGDMLIQIIVPAAAALAMGWGLRWAGAGFRGARQSSN